MYAQRVHLSEPSFHTMGTFYGPPHPIEIAYVSITIAMLSVALFLTFDMTNLLFLVILRYQIFSETLYSWNG